MANTKQNRKKSCGIGCGIIALVGIVIVSVLVAVVGRPVREAKRTEQILIERTGLATSFTPTPDGSVQPQRVEAFLRVRERVFLHCGGFQDVLDDKLGLDELENDTQLSGMEKATRSVLNLGGLFGFGPKFLEFVSDRNTTLLDEEMGLGEYIYIYVLAYSEQLTGSSSRYAEMDEARISERTTGELAEILRNQLAALTAEAQSAESELLTVDLREQISFLEDGSQSIPWQAAVPAAVAASFAPYADRLASLYCEGIAKVELLQKNKGLAIKG